MDRAQRRTRLLIAGLALLLVGSAEAAQVPIRDARWLQTRDLATDLTHQPEECLALPSDPAKRQSVEIGRIAFRAPLLLGGQAARAGMSCSTCHRNGRTNPDFHFPGLSGAPGTADVTSSIMSEHRGDGIFNPVTIPDLGGDPAKLKQKGTPHLRTFIHGLITQEFDGHEPPPRVLDGLTAYVNQISPAACKGRTSSPVALDAMLADVDTAVRLAEEMLATGDEPTAIVMLRAARSSLGSIDERFRVPGDEASRQLLQDSDAELRGIELADKPTPAMFKAWRKDWPDRKRQLRSAEPRSLYSEAVLRQFLSR
jgi:hypothetical protein